MNKETLPRMSVLFRFSFALLNSCPGSVESGTWEDADGSEGADDGESVSYVATVKNEGTVTVGALVLVDDRAGMTCEGPESGLLGQGETIECRGSTEVRLHCAWLNPS